MREERGEPTMTMNRWWFASLMATLCLVLAGIAPATAADPSPTGESLSTDSLQVSLNGVTWTDAIKRPLFDPAVRWVPGDTRIVHFFVRNLRSDDGDLHVVLDRAAATSLLDSGYLDISARAGQGRWLSIVPGGRQVMSNSGVVGSTSEMEVQVRATLDADAPNLTMVLATDLSIEVTLNQAGVVADANSGNGSGGGNGNGGTPGTSPDGPTAVDAASGGLPDTGSPLRPWLLPLALLLLAAGAVLMARRRDDDEDPDAVAPCADLEVSPVQP